jgi:phosphopantothenoylcysteine decarboxylase/phosphopantothenate--cysteine ligase
VPDVFPDYKREAVARRTYQLAVARPALARTCAAMRPILIVGGAPRLAVDAIRYLSVRATGTTARGLAGRLRPRGLRVDLLLADPGGDAAMRFDDREGLEAAVRSWIDQHADGVVVLSAAINDYRIDRVEVRRGGATESVAPGAKIASGADELVIRLRPADKLIDRLRGWGLVGPLVAFKFEDAATVVGSAQALMQRTGAALVGANSLCGTVLALVRPEGVAPCVDRTQFLDRLAEGIAGLAS